MTTFGNIFFSRTVPSKQELVCLFENAKGLLGNVSMTYREEPITFLFSASQQISNNFLGTYILKHLTSFQEVFKNSE